VALLVARGIEGTVTFDHGEKTFTGGWKADL
jgi:hypothetical protein